MIVHVPTAHDWALIRSLKRNSAKILVAIVLIISAIAVFWFCQPSVDEYGAVEPGLFDDGVTLENLAGAAFLYFMVTMIQFVWIAGVRYGISLWKGNLAGKVLVGLALLIAAMSLFSGDVLLIALTLFGGPYFLLGLGPLVGLLFGWMFDVPDPTEEAGRQLDAETDTSLAKGGEGSAPTDA